jgi:hypothetical protein
MKHGVGVVGRCGRRVGPGLAIPYCIRDTRRTAHAAYGDTRGGDSKTTATRWQPLPTAKRGAHLARTREGHPVGGKCCVDATFDVTSCTRARTGRRVAPCRRRRPTRHILHARANGEVEQYLENCAIAQFSDYALRKLTTLRVIDDETGKRTHDIDVKKVRQVGRKVVAHHERTGDAERLATRHQKKANRICRFHGRRQRASRWHDWKQRRI